MQQYCSKYQTPDHWSEHSSTDESRNTGSLNTEVLIKVWTPDHREWMQQYWSKYDHLNWTQRYITDQSTHIGSLEVNTAILIKVWITLQALMPSWNTTRLSRWAENYYRWSNVGPLSGLTHDLADNARVNSRFLFPNWNGEQKKKSSKKTGLWAERSNKQTRAPTVVVLLLSSSHQGRRQHDTSSQHWLLTLPPPRQHRHQEHNRLPKSFVSKGKLGVGWSSDTQWST